MVVDADLLVHVVDASTPEPDEHIAAVRAVLAEIGAADVPELVAFNKIDLAAAPAQRLAEHASRVGGVLGPDGGGRARAAAGRG